MSDLYVCKEYETPYEEGYRVVRTIEEHNKMIYNQALENVEKRYREWSKSEYGKIVADDVLPLRVIRSLRK